MSITAKVDNESVFAGLDRLTGKLRTDLARSMAVAGGTIIRDEAKARAPVGTEEKGSIYPGALRDAIYLAYRDGASTEARQMYAVSWNAKKAPHGHLLEFGHWQIYKIARVKGGYGGGWFTTSERLAAPKWTPAYPFLRPANEAAGARAVQAMIDRGAERLPELLAEGGVL